MRKCQKFVLKKRKGRKGKERKLTLVRQTFQKVCDRDMDEKMEGRGPTETESGATALLVTHWSCMSMS